MTRLTKRYSQWAAAAFLAAALAGCQESDVVAPDGATISLNANPATIVLAGGVQDPNKPVTIIATVSNSIGVPLPGQDVRFTTTSGVLTPTAGTPVETDSFGNATTVLTEARQSSTITAKSGKVSQTLQLQTAPCALNVIVLSPSSLPLEENCNNQEFPVTAEAFDTAGDKCKGIQITFKITVPDANTDVTGTFDPTAEPTNSDGLATSTLKIASDCNAKCVDKNYDCTGFITATSGSVESNRVDIEDNF